MDGWRTVQAPRAPGRVAVRRKRPEEKGATVAKLRSTLALAVAGLLAGGVLAAVTGPGDGGGELSLIAHSAEAAADAGTFRAEYEMAMEVPGEGSLRMEGEGEFDEEGPAGRMTMRMAGGGGTPFEDGAFEIEMLFVGTVFYMNMGELGSELGAPTPWVSFDLSSVPGMSDLLGGGGGGLGTNDPSQYLDMLRGAGSARELGREDVRGVPTTHYSGVVNVQDALDAAPEEQRDALEKMMDTLEGQVDFGALEFPVEAWIDDQGLPRRIRMEMALPAAGTSMTFTMEMFDFGAPVNVEPPPADQVTDMTEAVQSQLDPS